MSPRTIARVAAFCGMSLCSPSVPTEQAAAQTPTTESDKTFDEVVVTAQRIGIPVWRVTGPRTTIVLVGSIGRVVPGTQWDPELLDTALTQADRIM